MADSKDLEARPRGNRVEGKVAIVTGSGSGRGIGRATAELLAREGAKVIVADRNAEGGEETVRRIRAAGGAARFIQTDVSREADCVGVVAQAVDGYGRLDVLVNNAAIYPRATLEETTLEFWHQILATDLDGPFLLCREAIPRMIKGGGGSIVNVGSANGLGGGSNLVAYSTAKGGLLALTRNVAAAYAGQRIRVNYLIPGWVLSDNERVIQGLEGHDADWLAERAGFQPSGRFSNPEDAALGILFLASDESAHVSGTILNTDGGSSMLPNARRFGARRPTG
ncbi:MAG: SDR family NAD(P)-dependent oxidoreductase [Chloroflexota bacterium]